MNTSNSSYPVVAGVLSIVSGALGVLMSAFLFLFALVSWSDVSVSTNLGGELSAFTFFLVWGIVLLVLSILAIIGGIFALRRRYWGMALTGSIAAVLTFLPAGIVAVIFVALGKQDFK